MYLGEVCLLTKDVPRLASFYRMLLGLHSDNQDTVHQALLSTEPMLTVLYDAHAGTPQNIALAFSVDDVDEAHLRLQSAGVSIACPPTDRPWGARNMSIFDPDGNLVYLRALPK